MGSQRFLQRLWRLAIDEGTGALSLTNDELDDQTLHVLHRTIQGVREDMEGLRLNTAIAKLIELVNHLTKKDVRARAAVEPLLLMVAPIAPHLAEELWSRAGHATSLAYEPFPEPDPRYLVAKTMTCVVQVSGKLRAKLEVSPDATDDELRELALADPVVASTIHGRVVRKVIVKAPKLVSIVV